MLSSKESVLLRQVLLIQYIWIALAMTPLLTEATICPNFVSRSSWNATASRGGVKLKDPVKYVIVHDSGPGYGECHCQMNCSRIVHSMQFADIYAYGYSDISFNFLIGGDGKVYEGLGWHHQSTHATVRPKESISICFIGDFRRSPPSRGQIDALYAMINAINCQLDCPSLECIAPEYIVKAHRDVVKFTGNTNCPGDALYNRVKTWPQYRYNKCLLLEANGAVVLLWIILAMLLC